MNFAGIDPGVSGGIFLCSEKPQGFKMPETDRDLWLLFKHFRDDCDIKYVVMEKVHAMPTTWTDKVTGQIRKQGSTSLFTFGESFGLLRGMLVAAEIPFELVAPQTWQKLLSMSRIHGEEQRSFKSRLKERAQNLFPHTPIINATADAALLSYVARILWANSHPDLHIDPMPKPKPLIEQLGLRAEGLGQ
jgi:hypothetical protein